MLCVVFFFQAEDGIRDLVRSRGLGDVYKRQVHEYISDLKLFRDFLLRMWIFESENKSGVSFCKF